MTPICETQDVRRNDLGNCCEKCEGCAFWFMEDLREAGFKGIIFGVQEKAIRL
jgi:hypothetical protein